MNMEEVQKEIEALKQERIKKFMAVGFTKEQAELLVKEFQSANLGFGGLF
jgi:CTP:phosphocholine cytidylyltransferase-like protein